MPCYEYKNIKYTALKLLKVIRSDEQQFQKDNGIKTGLWRYETAKHTIHHQLQEYLDKSPDGFSKWVTARLNNKLNVNLIDIFGKEDETLKALPQLRSIPVRIAYHLYELLPSSKLKVHSHN